MPTLRPPALAVAAALALGPFVPAPPALAQRPFSVYDPFYRAETARRGFDDGYALTGEVSYRGSGSAGTVDAGQLEPNPLGLALRLDYGLSRHLDVGAIVDATGAGVGRSLTWSWVVARYFWTAEAGDYSFRLALDPASDGRVGFPQADLAFLSTSTFSPVVSSDFAVGVRRVQRGYQQVVPLLDPVPATPPEAVRDVDVLFNRAFGWEVHLMTTYNVHLGPSGSKVYATLAADRGQYELQRVRSDAVEGETGEVEAPEVRRYRGGVVWLRGGVELARPSYRLAPFIGIPLVQWTPSGTVPARPTAGVALTLR